MMNGQLHFREFFEDPLGQQLVFSSLDSSLLIAVFGSEKVFYELLYHHKRNDNHFFSIIISRMLYQRFVTGL